ncbi:MAG: hypothetical protein KAW87_07475 [Candidatus Cloacimonetes bacterium]|nr:hypothetical protein [Candidatus Cloacimonadota bacterium]
MKIFFLLIIIFLLSSLLFAESEWTVLVYIAADNTLFNAAFKDINEMEAVGSSDSVNIIVQVDPVDPDVYPSSYFDFGEARRYFITHDENSDSIGSTLLYDLGEINSADPTEVSDFANWGFSTYPSEKRMLILWDHGNGWSKDDGITKSVCNDYNSGDNISVADGELKQAISNINYHLDILAFDACLMQMPEVIGEIYEYCDFVIGSEDEIPEDGLPYGDITYHQDGIFDYLVENPSCSPEEFSNEIVTRYINSYLYGGSQATADDISLSAIKIEYFPEFQNKLFSFTSEYSDTLNNYIYENVRANIQVFNNSNIDVYQLFSQLANYTEFQESTNEILCIIDSMVVRSIAVYNNEIISDIGRMSLYFPQYSTGFFDRWQKYYQLSFVKETRWDRFLNFYYNDDNQYPIIKNFSISSVNNFVQFSWQVIDASYIKYNLSYNPNQDNYYVPIHDSTYIFSHNLTTTLPSGTFNFILMAVDEFENRSCVWKTAIISDKSVFKFFPNPYFVNDDENGRFIFSTGNSEKAEIFIYNFAGELVEKLITLCEENSTCELPFSPENLSSGIYFCFLKTGDRTNILKLAIIK